jgi:simple sugar transport system substrate-binding protein
MKKQLTLILSGLAVLAMLAACAPAVTPVPPTAAPPPPAATQPPPPPAAGAKWCSGVTIVFFPGGPEGGVFAVNVYNGAKQAEADLGPKVN